MPVAGGIGITPLIGAAQALCRRGADFPLHFAVRSRGDAPISTALRLLGERPTVHAGARPPSRSRAVFAALPPETCLFCGPMRMLEAARLPGRLRAPAADLRYETFGSSGQSPRETFRVGCGCRHRDRRPARPLDAGVLNEAGHEVIGDCRRGECGVCAIDVVEVDGEIDHRDVFFSEDQKQESRKLCTCVSRAHGVITVDTLERAGRDLTCANPASSRDHDFDTRSAGHLPGIGPHRRQS